MKRLALVLLCGVLMGCKGPRGDTGARGPTGLTGNKGDTGDTGVALIKTYSGVIPSSGNLAVSVPEILNKKGSAFVDAYWAFSGIETIYTKMSDGWLDNTTSSGRVMWVSWDFGKVYLNYMTAGDLYLIHVYSVNGNSAPMPSGRIGDRLIW